MANILEHGIIAKGSGVMAYYGWGTVARLGKKVFYAASGPRFAHICPYGKTSVWVSEDEGRHFSGPHIVNDSYVDDRDAGILVLEDETLLISYFASDTRVYEADLRRNDPPEAFQFKQKGYANWDDERVKASVGMWMMKGKLGHPFKRVRAPLSAPHGPIRLKDGSFVYFGKAIFEKVGKDWAFTQAGGAIQAAVSDDGLNWRIVGSVAAPEGTSLLMFHEPHVCELADGTLLGTLRYQREGGVQGDTAYVNYDTWLTRSSDGGVTWSVPQPMSIGGMPAHVMVHSSGAVVLSYGYRRGPFGQRAVISRDGGKTFEQEIILRDDGPSHDLGYPSTVELDHGDLYTAYYQQLSEGAPTSILYTRWQL